MPAAPNEVFSTLADPTRRAIFERLMRDGELTVHALTDRAGVSATRGLRAFAGFESSRVSCATGAMAARPITAPVRRVLRL